jgi:hypothetical protein
MTKERRAKISASMSGENNPNFGKKRSEETCAKIKIRPKYSKCLKIFMQNAIKIVSPKILLTKCMNVLIKGWGNYKLEGAHASN